MFARKTKSARRDFDGASMDEALGTSTFAPESSASTSASAFVPGPIVPTAVSSAFGHFAEGPELQMGAPTPFGAAVRETDPIRLGKPKKPTAAKKVTPTKPAPAPPASTDPVGPVREPIPQPDPDDVACDEAYPDADSSTAREMCKMGNKLKMPLPEGGQSVRV